MLAKRIIPCLDIRNGRTVKGTNFVDIRDAGDPVELAVKYSDTGADELVFLDISATHERRTTMLEWVKAVGSAVQIPYTVGGGIESVETGYNLLYQGADKLSINSAAVRDPRLLTQLAEAHGSQCVTLAIDARQVGGEWIVHTHGGRESTSLKLFEWAKEGQERGCGEILFTSMDHDGTKNGFALSALQELQSQLSIPVIASGGAGRIDDFIDLFTQTDIDAGLAASIFHFGEVDIPSLKRKLSQHHIPVRI